MARSGLRSPRRRERDPADGGREVRAGGVGGPAVDAPVGGSSQRSHRASAQDGGRLSDVPASRVNDEESRSAEPARRRQLEESRLIDAARTDREAFGQLYDLYVDDIYHYVLRRVGDVELAEDLTGAVWEHALGAISRYEHRGVPFAAWLYRIAGNLIANHFRRARLRQFVPFMGQVAVPDSSGRLDDRDAIRQALRELSLADQEVLALHYFAGLTPPEISGVLGCAVPVVHKRLQRARERLRVRFEGDSSVTRA